MCKLGGEAVAENNETNSIMLEADESELVAKV
jgi:hypothetical protein